jgi:ribonuclease Z
MKRYGIDLTNQLTDLILTHFHPDHVSGVPSLIMNCWLQGRQAPLHVYGLAYTIERVQKLMEMYEMDTWPHFFPLHYHPLPESERTLVMECPEWRILASPVQHIIPTIGLRIEAAGGRSASYSCDTHPSPAVVNLARGADVLIHEAAGASAIHSTPEQAGAIAAEAGVQELYLIHYPPSVDEHDWIQQAQSAFSGKVTLAKDFMEINL